MNYHQILNLYVFFLSEWFFFLYFYLFARKEAFYSRFLTQIKMTSKITVIFKKKFELIKLLPAEELNSSLKNIETMEDTRIHFAKDNLKSFFLHIFIWLSIFFTVLLSSAEGERSFSCLKRIESDLLITMGQNQLSSLSIINDHFEIARKLTLSNLIEIFASTKRKETWIF